MISQIRDSVWRLSPRVKVQFGAVALTLLAVAALTGGMIALLRPG